jgi:hypothetical protein
MKRIIYQVYVGNRSKLYDHCVASVADYCKEHDIEHVVQRQPILRVKPDVFATNRSKESYEKHGGFLPIFEKENAFKYLWTHDQVAIVDADIWIRPGSPNIFDKVPMEYDFGGVVEREMPCTPQYYQKITNYSRMQYSNLKQVDWKWNQYGGEFFNMGMMVLNKPIAYFLKNTPSAAAFLQQAKYKDFIDGIGNWKWSTDQTLLNYWVKEERMKTKHLTFHWNGLFSAIPEERIRQANFVHFFLKDKLPARGENVKQLMEMVV